MTITYSVDTPEARAAVRAAVVRGEIQRSPVSSVVICAMLDVDRDMLDSMHVVIPSGVLTVEEGEWFADFN